MLLPEDTRPRPPIKPRRRRGFYVVIWLLLFVLAVTLGSTVAVLFYRPALIGFERGADLTQTQVMIAETAVALEATGSALDATAQANAQQGFANQSTAAALNNRIEQVDRRETQSARDLAATSTNIALVNAQQATQSALDYQGTQTAFERMATQVELDYQGTQAALNQNATAVALGFATDTAPELQDIDASPPPDPLFNEGFTTGLSTGLWTYSDISDWSLDVEGILIAAGTRAWLLTERDDFQTYTLETVLLPVANQTGFYYVLLNTAPQSGLAVEINYDGTRVTATGLYRVNRQQITGDSFLANQNLTALQAVQIALDPATRLTVQVQVREDRLGVFINETLVLDIPLDASPPSGAVGVYVPTGTGIERIAVG